MEGDLSPPFLPKCSIRLKDLSIFAFQGQE